MPSVDNRVVEMNFDNAAFERKVATTLTSLEQLQKSLDMANAARGFEEVNRAARSFNLGGIAGAVDGVSAKFLAMSTIAITALANITNKAVDAGLRIAKSLTIAPILDGFREYETNMNSIQTILANTKDSGGNLDSVNNALDQLNEYSDQTIYNFSEMARNIGTFTAAGVELQPAVNAIKGIANLAAISGSNSQQASTAMYQLSQALAAGKVNLMDWNSVVNAGMGGAVFKKALFETGKAMGTITDVPLSASFDEWEEKGGTFREQMQKGWLTADVLSTTLEAFSGDLDVASLQMLGFSETAAQEMVELGELGIAAATEVKTLTQLMSTVKESVASGWSQSFRIVIGDFEQAKELFTDINNAIGGFVGRSSEARNELLQSWADMGGRTDLIEGLKNAFNALGDIIKPITNAFREVFPAPTALRLVELTHNFLEFTERMQISAGTAAKLGHIFKGVFGVIEIGWTVIKEASLAFKDLFSYFTAGTGTGILDFFTDLGWSLSDLNDRLVENGGIRKFFEEVTAAVITFAEDPLAVLDGLKDKLTEVFNILFKGDFTGVSGWAEDSKIVDFFFDLRENLKELLTVPDGVAKAFGRLEQRFESIKKLGDVFEKIWDPIKNFGQRIGNVLDEIWDHIRDWFSNLGNEMATAAEPGDFDAAVDLINVGLLGGIAAILKKFLDGGINLDFGGGVLEGVKNSLEGLTGVLTAMQADIKANALLKIAGAVAALTLSMVVLASIDSVDLTKALTAMSVGFGQLIASLAIITKLSLGPKSAAAFTAMTIGLVALAAAMLLMAVAAKTLSSLDWDELAKGLGGVTALLLIVTQSVETLSKNSSGMITVGIGMIAMGIALNILAIALKQFAEMNWEELAKGFAAVGAFFLVITLAAETLSKNASGMIGVGISMIAMAIALNLLALAVKQFAELSWEELGKGAAALAGSLLLLSSALSDMGANSAGMIRAGIGLLIVSASLLVIAQVMEQFAGMSWEELGRGLAGLGGALLILSLAVNSMSGAILGAVSIGLIAGALWLLVDVVAAFADMSLEELGKGLLGIAAVLLTLGLSAAALSLVITPMILLGGAMLLLGAGFALFGVGANLVAKAFTALAKAGTAGIGVLMALIDAIILRIPALIEAFAIGIMELGMTILEGAPVLIEQLGVVILQLLETFITLIPDLKTAVIEFITAALETLRETAPDFINTGITLLLAFLAGIRDNIEELTLVAIDILTGFIQGLTERIGDITTAGLDLLIAFVDGIVQNLGKIVEAVGQVITAFITEVGNLASTIVTAGVDALVNFLLGITDNLAKVASTVTEMVARFITEVGKNAAKIATAGTDALVDFLEGLSNNWLKIVTAVGTIITDLITAIGNEANRIIDVGVDTVLAFIEGLGKNAVELADGAMQVITDFVNGLADAIRANSEELRNAGINLAGAIVSGITFGLSDKVGEVANAAKGLGEKALGAAGKVLGINSPSKEFIKIGQSIVEGFVDGIDDNHPAIQAASNMSSNVTTAFKDALSKASAITMGMDEFNPTITPVLDLTRVQQDAAGLLSMFGTNTLTPEFSYDQARVIASTDVSQNGSDSIESLGPRTVVFEQNNYSPEALSTADIYRESRSLIAVSKEELSIG